MKIFLGENNLLDVFEDHDIVRGGLFHRSEAVLEVVFRDVSDGGELFE